MRALVLILGATAFAVTAIMAALAAPASTREKRDLKAYCSGDAATFCSDNDPGSPEMDACFRKHMSELSENCRRAIKAYTAPGGK